MYERNDPAFRAFIQRKIVRARDAADYLKNLGIDAGPEELPNDDDLWYEYCESIAESKW
jgi:hypothetical protein